MSVNAVSYGQVATQNVMPKKNYVKKGALIAGGLAAASGGLGTYALHKTAEGGLKEVLLNAGTTKGKWFAMLAGGILGWALVGGIIGKIVEKNKAKKEQEQFRTCQA